MCGASLELHFPRGPIARGNHGIPNPIRPARPRQRLFPYERLFYFKVYTHQMASPTTALAASDYAEFVNPQWQRLLSVLGMNVRYAHCSGAELFTSDGRRIVDFLSGYCVHNAGHNHPDIIAAIKDELDRSGPAMLQSHVPEIAGELAARLCERAGGN